MPGIGLLWYEGQGEVKLGGGGDPEKIAVGTSGLCAQQQPYNLVPLSVCCGLCFSWTPRNEMNESKQLTQLVSQEAHQIAH